MSQDQLPDTINEKIEIEHEEDRPETRSERSQENANQASLDAKDRLVLEGNAGKADLFKAESESAAVLKAGGRSGITDTFGKPVLLDERDDDTVFDRHNENIPNLTRTDLDEVQDIIFGGSGDDETDGAPADKSKAPVTTELEGGRTKVDYADGSSAVYDRAGRLCELDRSDGTRFEAHYDKDGKLVRYFDQEKRYGVESLVAWDYDAELEQWNDASGRTRPGEVVIDPEGNVIFGGGHPRVVRRDGQTLSPGESCRDKSGKLLYVKPDGTLVKTRADNSRSEHLANGNQVHFESSGRVSALQRPDGRALALKYDAQGNVEQMVDRDETGQAEVWKRLATNVWDTGGPMTRKHGDVQIFVENGTWHMPEQTPLTQQMLRVFESNFDRLDISPKDGAISRSEIDAAFTDHNFKGEDALLLLVLKDKYEKLEQLNWYQDPATLANPYGLMPEPAGITRADMKKLESLSANDDIVKEIAAVLEKAKGVLESDRCPDLYATENAVDSIKPQACNQGRIGDCYFLGALAALSALDPMAIEKMVKPMGKNSRGVETYQVDFPGQKSILVEAPTDSELCQYSRGSRYGMWAAVIEKAAGKYYNGHPDQVPQDALDGGSSFGAGVRLLTGKGINFYLINLENPTSLHALLVRSISERRLMTVMHDGGLMSSWSRQQDLAGTEKRHALGVVGYDPETGIVTVFDSNLTEPGNWFVDKGENHKDGIFSMHISDFANCFTKIWVSEPD